MHQWPRLREVKRPAQGHRAREWQRFESWAPTELCWCSAGNLTACSLVLGIIKLLCWKLSRAWGGLAAQRLHSLPVEFCQEGRGWVTRSKAGKDNQQTQDVWSQHFLGASVQALSTVSGPCEGLAGPALQMRKPSLGGGVTHRRATSLRGSAGPRAQETVRAAPSLDVALAAVGASGLLL